MSNPFAINPNMFAYQQPVNAVGGIGVRGPEQTGETRPAGGVGGAGATGGSAVDRDLADMRRFLPAYNGTGELRPNNDEEGATLRMLYA